MYLVLNPSTGLVSLQYHVTFNDIFETARYDQYNTNVPMTWQQLPGLINPMEVEPGITHKITRVTNEQEEQNDR